MRSLHTGSIYQTLRLPLYTFSTRDTLAMRFFLTARAGAIGTAGHKIRTMTSIIREFRKIQNSRMMDVIGPKIERSPSQRSPSQLKLSSQLDF